MSEQRSEGKKEPIWKTIHLKENRDKCYAARDEFYKCMLRIQVEKMKRPFDPIDYSPCREARQHYKSVCPGSWIRIFDKQHNYVPRKDVGDDVE